MCMLCSMPVAISVDFTEVSKQLVAHGSVLERVSSYRYLGVMISSDLFWSNHIKDINSKAQK